MSAEPSHWVDRLFRSLELLERPPSQAFVNRCKEVALAANAVAHMRSSEARRAFRPLTFSQFLEQLSYGADVEFEKILTFISLARRKSASLLDRASPAAIQLAFNVGIPRDFLKVYLKLSCLADAGMPTAQLARLRSEKAAADISMSAVEDEIERLAERMKPSSVLVELRNCENEVDRIYDEEAKRAY